MKSIWRSLLPWFLRERSAFLGLLLTVLPGIGIDLLKPWPLKLLLDYALVGKPLPDSIAWISQFPGAGSALGLVAWLAASSVILFIGAWSLQSRQGRWTNAIGLRLTQRLGADLFDAVQHSSLKFIRRQKSGDLNRRVLHDATCAQDLLLHVLLPGLTSLGMLVAMGSVMFQMDAALAFWALAIIPLLAWAIRYYAAPLTDRATAQYTVQGELAGEATELLTGVAMVKAFGQEPAEQHRFRQLWQASDAAQLHLLSAELRFKIATSGATALGVALVLWFGGQHVLEGRLTVGSLVVFLAYLASLYNPLETLAYLSNGYASAAARARRVFASMEASKALPEAAHPESLVLTKDRSVLIRLENVTFGYEPGRAVLHGVNLEVRTGEIVALVGPSAAGKTTLLSLVPRLADPWQGRVTCNGLDVRELPLAKVRELSALLLQDPFLLPVSIVENIAYGRPGATRAEILQAARAAAADEFIRHLPEGYDTVLGERGVNLSGGQQQRIALARAFLKDAPILLLDEPTSALDAETEETVMQSIARLMQGRATLLIAHRLSTVHRASRILVLEAGRVVEAGTHVELMRGPGAYRAWHRGMHEGSAS